MWIYCPDINSLATTTHQWVPMLSLRQQYRGWWFLRCLTLASTAQQLPPIAVLKGRSRSSDMSWCCAGAGNLSGTNSLQEPPTTCMWSVTCLITITLIELLLRSVVTIAYPWKYHCLFHHPFPPQFCFEFFHENFSFFNSSLIPSLLLSSLQFENTILKQNSSWKKKNTALILKKKKDTLTFPLVLHSSVVPITQKQQRAVN